MTSSERSSQQQQQLNSSMHLQCVQAPNSISVAEPSADATASSVPHHHEFPINNNNTTSSKAAFVSSSPSVLSTNHNNNETCASTGSLTSSSISVSSSPSGTASSVYLSCCSDLSLNGQAGGGLKISDNHLSTKLARNSGAPYVISKQHGKQAVVVSCDEQAESLQRAMLTTTPNMGSTVVNGTGIGGGGGVSVICGMNGGGGGNANLIKVEPNGNSIDINSVDNPLHLSTMHLHHSSNGTNGGGTSCCHHTLGPINHFSGGGMPTPTSNGIIENCDLDNSNNGNSSEMSNGGIVPMDTANVFGRHNGNQCSHQNYSASANNSNTLVSPLLSSSSAPLGMTMVSCNSSNCNGNGVGATNTTTTTIALNGGTNDPCVGNNMSPGEDVDEHDCDDDKVINGDTFGLAGESPDSDSIKMFVGQIPKHMNETDLRELFEKYGRVYQINVLRDKATKQSKGCCFVTFFTRKAALDAQNALHNVKTLPGMNNTVQMKPADNENRYDRKLFIGMISKKLNETDVRNMFSRFGTIDDCTVLRLPTGESRGCAFVTFSTKQSAQNAIKAVHQSVTMEGCSSAIVVKFADTPKDKDQKRQSQIVSNPANLLSTLSSTTIAPVQQQYYSAVSPVFVSDISPSNAFSIDEMMILHHQLQQQQQPQQGGFFSQLSPLGVQGITGIGGLGSTSATALPGLSSAHLSTTNTDLATLTGLLSGVTQNPHSLTVQNLHTLAALGNSSLSPTGTSVCSMESGSSIANLTGSGLQSGLTSYHTGLRSAAVSAKQQTEGPEGCNLFIYHLPPECGDAELAQMFISFGTVLSAKVFIDKQTNLSKCFGFVSFDNQLSAQMAIQAMNGFQVGMKRLKVQLKRSKSKDAAKPY